jgi:hypothetical protein
VVVRAAQVGPVAPADQAVVQLVATVVREAPVEPEVVAAAPLVVRALASSSRELARSLIARRQHSALAAPMDHRELEPRQPR